MYVVYLYAVCMHMYVCAQLASSSSSKRRPQNAKSMQSVKKKESPQEGNLGAHMGPPVRACASVAIHIHQASRRVGYSVLFSSTVCLSSVLQGCLFEFCTSRLLCLRQDYWSSSNTIGVQDYLSSSKTIVFQARLLEFKHFKTIGVQARQLDFRSRSRLFEFKQGYWISD